MPEGIEVGGGGDSIAGIPKKYALIGLGALAVGGFLLWQKSGSGSGGSGGTNATYGAALGPNAALALGDLQTRLMQESGRLQEQFSGGLDKLSGQIDTAASALGDQGTHQQQQLFDYLNTLSASDASYATRLYMMLGGRVDQAGRFVAGIPPVSTSPANPSMTTT